MKLKEVIVENKINDYIKSFLPLAQDYLKIDKLPKILLVDTVPDTNGTTFGRYEPENNLIYLVAKGRHPKDTLRTLAHELVHYHQGVEHRLSIDSGETGSTEENEANAVAGILMRNFNEQNPEELHEGRLEDIFYDMLSHAIDKIRNLTGADPKQFNSWCQGQAKDIEAEMLRLIDEHPERDKLTVIVIEISQRLAACKSANEFIKVSQVSRDFFNKIVNETLAEDFTGQAKPGSRPGSLRRKAGLKKGQTMSQADLLRLQGRATEMKRSSSKATRDRGIQLARQINWYKNFHKKKSEAVGYE